MRIYWGGCEKNKRLTTLLRTDSIWADSYLLFVHSDLERRRNQHLEKEMRKVSFPVKWRTEPSLLCWGSLRWYKEETTEPVVHLVLPSYERRYEVKCALMLIEKIYLEPMQFSIIIWSCQTCEHEVIRVLKERLGIASSVDRVIWMSTGGWSSTGCGRTRCWTGRTVMSFSRWRSRLLGHWVDYPKLNDWRRVDRPTVS